MSVQIFMTATEAVLPIVLLILLGYFLRQKNFFSDTFIQMGNKLMFRIGLPTMLFVSVYGIKSLSEINWDICLYCVWTRKNSFLWYIRY